MQTVRIFILLGGAKTATSDEEGHDRLASLQSGDADLFTTNEITRYLPFTVALL